MKIEKTAVWLTCERPPTLFTEVKEKHAEILWG